jgi:hypothetical protein
MPRRVIPAIGLFCVHGGSGSPFIPWVILRGDRGYAAIFKDTCGCTTSGGFDREGLRNHSRRDIGRFGRLGPIHTGRRAGPGSMDLSRGGRRDPGPFVDPIPAASRLAMDGHYRRSVGRISDLIFARGQKIVPTGIQEEDR